jgi:hypothetical protein
MYVTHFSKTTQIDIKQAADPNIKADPIWSEWNWGYPTESFHHKDIGGKKHQEHKII